MTKCYHCGQELSDEWIIHHGAILMGKIGNEKLTESGNRKIPNPRLAGLIRHHGRALAEQIYKILGP